MDTSFQYSFLELFRFYCSIGIDYKSIFVLDNPDTFLFYLNTVEKELTEYLMKKISIIGTGSYLPEKIMTNFDIEKFLDTSDEWIYTRTGIKERRVAEKDTSNL